MKDGAMLLKTARGAMIDKAAMADKLYCGKIASVGLDVYENELVANVKLVRNVRALLVPHFFTGASSWDSYGQNVD